MRVGAGAVVVLLIAALAIAVLVSALTAPGGDEQLVTPTAAIEQSGSVIYVHVLGAVREPGLYRLRDGDRAVDAVAAAGGFTEGADQSQLNLARFISDGEQIVVPVLGTEPAQGGQATQGKVNINTADSATLETLPRVGPAMAQRIIAWREANGRFASIEDLLAVTGIGSKTFEGLRDLVTI